MSPRQISRRLRTATQVQDMLPGGFKDKVEELPKTPPPRWMAWSCITSIGVTVVVLVATLLGPMDEFVLASGSVRPAEYALVFPQVDGSVAEVLAHPGMTVTKGQLLARLDITELERGRATLEAELAQAVADQAIAVSQLSAIRVAPLSPELLFLARSVDRHRQVVVMRHTLLERMEGLGQTNNVSLLELTRERLSTQAAELELERAQQAALLLEGDYAKAQVSAAEAQVQAAADRIKGLERRRVLIEGEVTRREIHAPADGLVVSRAVRFAGEKVQLGTALFKLAYGSATELRLYASEDRVHRIKPGMMVRFRTHSDPDRLTKMSLGRVQDVALDGALEKDEEQAHATRATYAINVSVKQASTELPLGATVDAEIVLGQRPFWHLLLLKREPKP